jgi:hypothetical protein
VTRKRMKELAAVLVVLVVGLLAWAVLPANAAPTPQQLGWGHTYTCTTNSTGYCTVTHSLGVVPDAVTVSPVTSAIVSVDQVTATNFRVRFAKSIASSGSVTAWASTAFSFYAHFDWVEPAAPSPSASATSSPPPPPAAWPDATNTGVPAGTTLTPYTGPCTITVANTVIDAATVNCDLTIQAAGVQITRSQITGSVSTPDDMATTAGFTLTDSEVSFPTITADGRTMVGSVNFTMLRTEVTGGNRGVYCRGNCTVQDSWVHGTLITGSLHASALRMSQHATIVHNTLNCDVADNTSGGGCSADLTGYGDFEPVTNNLVKNNLFKTTPGGACAYGGSSAGKPYSTGAHDIVFQDNVFEYGPVGDHGTRNCGFYFPITAFDTTRPGNQWINNTWEDGATVPPA